MGTVKPQEFPRVASGRLTPLELALGTPRSAELPLRQRAVSRVKRSFSGRSRRAARDRVRPFGANSSGVEGDLAASAPQPRFRDGGDEDGFVVVRRVARRAGRADDGAGAVEDQHPAGEGTRPSPSTLASEATKCGRSTAMSCSLRELTPMASAPCALP